jgi:hypothetical protein
VGGVAEAGGVVGVEDSKAVAGLGFKEAALGGFVILHGVVAIEVIGSEVETDADGGAEVVDGFQLEAGDFQDVPLIGAGRGNHGGGRGTDVAAHLVGDAGDAEDVTGEGGGGGFAVGAGNGEDGTQEEIAGELEFADDRDAGGAGGGDGRGVDGHAGGDDKELVGGGEEGALGLVLGDAGGDEGAGFGEKIKGFGVAGSDVGAVLVEELDGGDAGTSQAEDDNGGAAEIYTCYLHGHLNFRVVSANRAKTSPAIQNRMMTFDSSQPRASK